HCRLHLAVHGYPLRRVAHFLLHETHPVFQFGTRRKIRRSHPGRSFEVTGRKLFFLSRDPFLLADAREAPKIAPGAKRIPSAPDREELPGICRFLTSFSVKSLFWNNL